MEAKAATNDCCTAFRVTAMSLALVALAASARAAQTGDVLEGVALRPTAQVVEVAPWTPSQARARLRARRVPNSDLVPGPATASAAATGPGAMAAGVAEPEIVELARALRHDPQLIYEYVHDKIEFTSIYGVTRGALGTLIDRRGNSFDQSALMVALLRESGYTASFVHGELQLDAAQLRSWLDISSWYLTVLYTLAYSGIPASVVPSGCCATDYARVDHVWVKVNISGTDYAFDPSLKDHSRVGPTAGLPSIMGFDIGSFLATAMTGATQTADYVQGIDRAGIRNALVGYANNIVNYIRTQPSYKQPVSVRDVVGGKQIIPLSGPVWNTTHPNLVPGTEETWVDIPAPYRKTLRVEYQGIDATLYADEIYGKRLTLFFDASDQPVLRAGGVAVATGLPTVPGSVGSVTLSVAHPFTDIHGSLVTDTVTRTVKGGVPYLIVNGWDTAIGRDQIDRHRLLMAENRLSGLAEDSEPVLGEAMAMLLSSWLGETGAAAELAGKIGYTNIFRYDILGVVGHDASPYVDLHEIGNTYRTTASIQDSSASWPFLTSGYASALEWGAIEQLQATSAVSTVKLLDMAAANADKIFDVTSANFPAVQPQLISYSASDLASIQARLDGGFRILLPENGAHSEGGWTGVGYLAEKNDGAEISHVISGGLNGGFGTTPTTPQQVYDAYYRSVMSYWTFMSYWRQDSANMSRDPIHLVNGQFLYEASDLSVGSQSHPIGLELVRSYASGSRLVDGPMGLGWSHNFDMSAKLDSDGFQALGEDSPIDAAVSIAAFTVLLELYQSNLLPETTRSADKMVAAFVVERWLMDQQIQNVARLDLPGRTGQFVRLADGSYNPPPGSAEQLTTDLDGSLRLRTKRGVEFDFALDGTLSTSQHPDGNALTFGYDGAGKLESVSNGFGRSLTFTYTGNHVTGVGDDTGRSVGFAYDAAGNLTGFTNAVGDATTYSYDAPGRLTQVFEPAHPTTPMVTNTYNALDQVTQQLDSSGLLWQYFFAGGQRTEEIDPAGGQHVWYYDDRGNSVIDRNQVGETTTHDYDSEDRLIKTVYPEGNRLEYSYDASHNTLLVAEFPKPPSATFQLRDFYTYDPTFNRVLSHVDRGLNVTWNTYDPTTGNLSTVQQPTVCCWANPLTTYTYNGQGQVVTLTDPEGRVSRYSYDPVTGDLLSATLDDGGLNLTAQLAYDPVGNVTSRTDPRGNTTAMQYDAMRRVTKSFAPPPFSYETRLSYDANGQLVQRESETRDAANPWQTTQFIYDIAGRVFQQIDPEGNVRETHYDHLDQPTIRFDEELRKTSFFYDLVRRLDRVEDNLDQVQKQWSYTLNGRKASVTDANGNATSYQYDEFDRLASSTFPDTTSELYGYDNLGNLISKTTRAGESISYSYDALHRLTAKTLPDKFYSFAYDFSGLPTQVDYPGGITSFAYDGAGRRTAESQPGGTTAYQYDAAGNRTRLIYSGGDFASYAYDELNRMTQVLDSGGGLLAQYGYDALSRRVDVAYGNGATTSYTYEPDDDLAVLSHQFTTSAVNYGITHNDAHQRTSLSIDSDAFVNWPVTASSSAYTTNVLNQYSQLDGVSYSYDGNGNLSGDAVSGYSYDAENRLTDATTPTGAVQYEYDATGRRTQTTAGGATTRFLHDGNRVIEELDTGWSPIRRYVYGRGLDEPIALISGGATYYYHSDTLGSVIALSDENGIVAERYAYDAFGASATSSSALGNPYRYTGRRLDQETGLYYYRARYYNPALGRFLQPDPVAYDDGMNLYSYVGNDPLNRLDPLGLFGVARRIRWSQSSQSVGGVYALTGGVTREQARRMIMNAQNPHPGVSPGFDDNRAGPGFQAMGKALEETAIDAALVAGALVAPGAEAAAAGALARGALGGRLLQVGQGFQETFDPSGVPSSPVPLPRAGSRYQQLGRGLGYAANYGPAVWGFLRGAFQ